MIELHWILSFLVLGAGIGVVAGLLGIGGGGIMVPVLTSLFLWQGMPVEKVVHLALGTSMASIVVTSISSLRAHHARGGVVWPIVNAMVPGVLAGSFLATFLVSYISSQHMAIFFSCYMAYMSTQMLRDKKESSQKRKPLGNVALLAAGTGIGSLSAMVSIGGGSLTVPFLLWQNIDIKKAIGSSAAMGLPISVAGTLGYMINGWPHGSLAEGTFGFVYLPAAICISLMSAITAPYGVRFAHRIPVGALRKIFAVLMVLLSVKMLSSVLF